MTPEENKFYSLIDTRDVNLLKAYYKDHKIKININRIYDDGETALHKAIGTRCPKMVRFIMQLRPNTEVYSRNWTPLHKAVHENNEEAVNILLAHNANVNARTKEHGKTPLHMAVFNDSMTIAHKLLKQYANPNLTIHSGTFQSYSALHIAVVNHHRYMVELLLCYRVNTELRCYQGYTALWLAVLNSYTEIVECLCRYHANCDSKPTSGPYMNCTPLFAAIELNKVQMAKILIKNSVNVNARDDSGRTPLYHAVYLGHHEMSRLLINSDAIVNVYTHSGTYKGSSPLFAAVYNKNYSMVKWLLNNKAYVNVKRADGNTPLHCAVQSACYVIAKLLINYHAKVNVSRGWNGCTPLHDAVLLGDTLMVNLLLRKHARPNVKNSKGETPLYHAAQLGYWRIVNYLLKFGANPNLHDNKQNSPLHVAIRAKQFKTVILLLQGGAKVDVLNNRSQTPLYLALQSENESIIKILLNRGAELTTRCIPRSSPGYFKYITDERTLLYLIKQGVNVNHQSTEGETALHRLIQISIPEVVAYIKSFMDINPVNKDGIIILDKDMIIDELVYPAVNGSGIHAVDYHNFNAIHMAVHKRAVDLFKCSLMYGTNMSIAINIATSFDSMKCMLQTLLNNGADTERADKLGFTPLHLATKCRHHAYMRILLENGAKVDPEDRTGATPLMLAIRNMDSVAVTILLGFGATGTSLMSIAYRFCDQRYKLTQVLLQFECVKKKYIEDKSWPTDPPLELIVEACKNEIEELKQTQIGNSRLQFIDLVIKPVKILVPFIRNLEIKQVLQLQHFKNSFPIFADEIKVKTGCMIMKNKIVRKCKQIVVQLFDGAIPCLVVDKILSYLNDAEQSSLLQTFMGSVRKKIHV